MNTFENINNEIWRPVDGYEGYEISNYGRLRRTIVTYIKPDLSDKRRARYCLYKSPKHKDYKREFGHILVAKAFPEICGDWFEGCEVHHKDRNSLNNRPENLICLSEEDHYKEHYNDLVLRAKSNFSKPRTKRQIDKMIQTKSKRINQYTLDGVFIKKWLSCTEVERQLGYDKAAINRCCLGKQKTSYGYIWEYAA